MSYSLELRHRVVLYVKDGGTKISACRHFKVSLWCVNDWCKKRYLSPYKTIWAASKIIIDDTISTYGFFLEEL